jgi:hypothetical protein
VPFTIAGMFMFIYLAENRHTIKSDIFLKAMGLFDRLEEEFFSFFHTKKKIIFIISGLLVLHFLSDIFSFLFPYLFGSYSSLYGEILGKEIWIGSILSAKRISGDWGVTLASYLMSVVYYMLASLFALYLWFCALKQKSPHINHAIVGLYFTSIIASILVSKISVDSLGNEHGLMGVYFYLERADIGMDISLFFVFAAAVFIISSLLSMRYHRGMILIGMLPLMQFITNYLIKYVQSMINFYSMAFISLWSAGQYLVMFMVGIFFILSMLLYSGGYLAFFYQIVRISWGNRRGQ